jgi:hypothetical protein
MDTSDEAGKTVIAQFYTTDGEARGSQMAIPVDITVEQLHYLLNQHILKNVRIFEKNIKIEFQKKICALICQKIRSNT